ncbi:permease [Leucobacter allii]|uniref:permease n=1 Tax=Leucobacter allii TaxID=2932247 RepID=UPI001FD0728C|nr:permease [Leucobacter allii]UOR02773.1 permease [Leucobacter allii]
MPSTARPARTGPALRIAFGAAIALALLAALLAVRAASGALLPGLPAAAADLVTLSLSVFIESLPFVFLGIVCSTLVRVWVPERVIDRVLPRSPALRRAALSLVGVVMPVCECGNVPLARGLMMRGFSVAEAATFLLAAPILNPVTILTTYHAFGWDHGILIARIAGGFAVANLVGWLLSTHPEPGALLAPRFRAACGHEHAVTGGRLRRSLEGLAEETSALLPALVIGSALAGAIQVGVPRELLLILGAHPLWSALALMTLAFVISICSSVDAFFILSLGSTFMPGSIVAFLLFGAMMDLKMLALLRTTFRGRALAYLAAVVGLSCLVIGWGMNLVA